MVHFRVFVSKVLVIFSYPGFNFVSVSLVKVHKKEINFESNVWKLNTKLEF